MSNIIPLIDTLRLEKIDDAIYFSKKYSNYISNSRLSLINPEQDGSPEKFFEGFKPSFSSSFQLGSAVHQLVLQNDLFELSPLTSKPTAKVGMIADYIYNKCKGEIPTDDIILEAARVNGYYKGNLSENQIQTVIAKCKNYWTERADFEASYTGDKELIHLDFRSRETVCNCVTAINSNKYIQEILHPSNPLYTPISENEQAILLDIKVNSENGDSFILKFKAKLDNYIIDKDSNKIIVNDVKTIGKFINEMENNISKFHYNREFAVYAYLLSLCAQKYYGMSNFKVEGNYLCVSTIPSYYTKVIPLTHKMFKEGMDEFKKLMTLVIKEVETNHRDFAYEI